MKNLRLRLIPAVCGLLVILTGLAVLIGWQFNNQALKSIFSDIVNMNPMTATSFILAGLSLLAWAVGGRYGSIWARVFGGMVVIIGAIKAVSFFGPDLGIDRFLFSGRLSEEGRRFPNRMAPNTTVNFVIFGFALLILDAGKKWQWLCQTFLALGFTSSFLALVGYLYGVTYLTGLPAYIPMALNTACAFTILGAGILSIRLDSGVMAVILHRGMGGTMVRRLLPFAVGFPIALGWIKLLGQQAGIYDSNFGSSFVAVMTIFLLTFLILANGASLNRVGDRLDGHIHELERAYKEIESFSYSVSHDLRAPLRGIMGFSEMLKEDYSKVLDEEGIRKLDTIQLSGNKMNQLIDGILTLSRFARKEIEKVEVDLSDMARGIVDELKIGEKNRTVHVSIADGITAWGDAVLLDSVMRNLLGNAWKYSSKKSSAEIEFGVKSEGNKIYFVRDNGAGFDMKQADNLFRTFQRLHSDEEFEGTGVGLATVQKIIHRHGGKIWVQAEVDRGAMFCFTLPEK